MPLSSKVPVRFKNSKQREKILRLLQGTDSHPNAEWIYTQLKPNIPSLSLGTVYRNLRILLEQGKIRRLENGSGFDRFDARLEPHYHFTCKICNEITDIFLESEKAMLDDAVKKSTGFQIDGHQIDFYGICKRCLSKPGKN